MILVPLYYQQVRGESVIVTGLLVGPRARDAAGRAPSIGRLTRFGARPGRLVGVSMLCLSTLPLAFVGADTSILLISVVLRSAGSRHRSLLHADDDRRLRRPSH